MEIENIRDSRKRNLIKLSQLRRWSIERLYFEIGRFDFTVTLEFKKDSYSYNEFGRMITGQLYFKKKDRKVLKAKINSGVKNETDGNILFTTILKDDLSKKEIKLLATKGFKNTDIDNLDYYGYKHNPTYFKKTQKKLEKPIKIKVPNVNCYKESYKMMLALFKKRINEGDDLIDFEKLEMMAIKKTLKIHDEISKYNFDELVKERKAEFDFMVEEILIRLKEIETYSNKVLKNKINVIKKIVDYEFKKAGINPDKPLEEIAKYLGLYSGLLQIGMMYRDEIILCGTKPKVVLNFKGFMHVAFRHWYAMKRTFIYYLKI